jgi:16S rRNA (uracil1498-N3)-methyltransferase
MARRRFFVDEVRRGEAELEGEDAEHLTRVLRAEPGWKYEITDGSRLYLGEIVEARKTWVRFRIVENLEAPEPAVRTVLAISLIKFDRLEWAIEKATELGVETIVLLRADRSEQGLELAAVKRIERWKKIARAAGRQSRRVHLPRIDPPVSIREAAGVPASHRFVLEETPGSPALLGEILSRQDRKPGETVAVAVGPEGGWTDRERSQFAASGWSPVSLGSQILRAETAAAAALAVISQGWTAAAGSLLR